MALVTSSLFEMIGGTSGCRELSAAFYARVAKDPVLRPLFPGKTFTCAIEEFTAFLVQFLGGPECDAQRRWWVSLQESHMRFTIGPEHRAAWMQNMKAAIGESAIAEPLRGQLLDLFLQSSAYVANQAPPHGQFALTRRWEAQLRLDQTVAAIRRGDAGSAIALAETAEMQQPGLFSIMIRSRHPDLRRYVHTKLSVFPDGANRRFAGRTLLHDAAAVADGATVELLLRLGLDANIRDGGQHTPLYSLANECGAPEGAALVRVLVDAGADVNACDGVKRCTPLHMAARRGHVEIAAALLDCGADLEARDSVGETPLRRAVNCNKVDVAALLAARGADVGSVGSKGVTPLLAARSAAMRRLLGPLDH